MSLSPNKKSIFEFDRDRRVLIRRHGFLFKKELKIEEVVKVISLNVDALTFDEVSIHFLDGSGRDFFMKEYEPGFNEAVSAVSAFFPGIESWAQVGVGPPMQRREVTLWSKSA